MSVGVGQALSWLVPRMWRADHNDEAPRVAGNSRLTAMVGIVLLVLLPVPYVSAPFLDQMWKVHFFGGLILLPLLGVKVASTSLRAASYYLGSRDYRAAGPPALIPRVTGPPLVLSTALLMGSGIQMALDGNRFSAWSTVHNASAVVFSAALAVHLLAHLQDTPRRIVADLRRHGRPRPARGPAMRVALVVAALVAGVGVAAGGLVVSHWTARPHRLHDVAHLR